MNDDSDQYNDADQNSADNSPLEDNQGDASNREPGSENPLQDTRNTYQKGKSFYDKAKDIKDTFRQGPTGGEEAAGEGAGETAAEGAADEAASTGGAESTAAGAEGAASTAGEAAAGAGETAGTAAAGETTAGAAAGGESMAAGTGAAATGATAEGGTAAATGAAASGSAAASGLTATGGVAAGAVGETAAVTGGATIASAAIAEGAAAPAEAVVAASPAGWIGCGCLLIILFLLIAFYIIAGIQSNKNNSSASASPTPAPGQETSNNPIPGLTLTKTAPFNVANGENITYTLSAVYTDINDVTLYDQIPSGTTFVAASGKHSAPDSSGIITWNLRDNATTGISRGAFSFTLTVKPTTQDTTITNQFWAEAPQPTPATGMGDANAPPNNSDCNGYYANVFQTQPNPLGNFGDPTCSLTTSQGRNNAIAMLKQLDPQNWQTWIYIVIPCESEWIPNSYASHERVGTPDPGGAWGLFQDGSRFSYNNDPLDRGDVQWEKQIQNVVNLLQERGWGYWYGPCEQNNGLTMSGGPR